MSGTHERDGGSKFDGSILDRSIIARPLIDAMATAGFRSSRPHNLIIDLNLRHRAGLTIARDLIYIEIVGYERWLEAARTQDTVDYLSGLEPNAHRVDLTSWDGITTKPLGDVVDLGKARYTPQYAYAKLTGRQIQRLVEVDGRCASRAMYKIWPDFDVEMMLTKSLATVKADAAMAAFNAAGDGIVWAVADTGVDGEHPHFDANANLDLSGLLPLTHVDFAQDTVVFLDEPVDPHGHGTHVAGIIAGESAVRRDVTDPGSWIPRRWVGTSQIDEKGDRIYSRWQLKAPISGVAPRTKIVSLRVLNEAGGGRVSNLLAAIGYVQAMNDNGRMLRIHGLNMSVGYGFDPEWFACGQSPLCVEVDRLVRSGVSVVVAAGNTGYVKRGAADSPESSGRDLTINDPGNAEEAITVGSTHREKPHTYGVSYFSSKGPTGDGRLKPDLVAPGEKVLSCATGSARDDLEKKLDDSDGGVDYRQESGTSMAAPHVSGAVAAFLSVRREFIGQPQRVKQIFLASATDLGRDRYFQGSGLVDIMRALQSL